MEVNTLIIIVGNAFCFYLGVFYAERKFKEERKFDDRFRS